MKILILTDGIYPHVIGGMQKHSFYLAKFLALRGHDITLVHCVGYGKPLPTQEETKAAMELDDTHKLTCIALHFPKAGVVPGHYLNESYLYSQKVYDRIKNLLIEYDFVYAKGFAAWYLLHKKSKGEKMPPVGIKFHGYEMFQPPASFKSRLEHYLLRGPVKWNNKMADYIFSYGGKITSIIERIGIKRERIIEIPTGIESAWCKTTPLPTDGTRRFVFVGRFERRKGVEELNMALQKLLGQFEFHMDFVGPVPASKKIKSEQITYHGSVTDKAVLQSILDQAHVLVVPSHSEGMPNVIMEGMARGLAVIATDVGAVSVVVNDKNGWLIQPGDFKEIEQALLTAIECNDTIMDELRKNSVIKIAEFYWENIAIKTEKMIEHLIQKR